MARILSLSGDADTSGDSAAHPAHNTPIRAIMANAETAFYMISSPFTFYSTSISFSGRYRKGVKVFLFSDSNFSVSNQGLGVWGKGPTAHKPFAEKRTDYPLGVE